LYVGDDEVVSGVGMARQVKVAPLVEVKHTQLKHQAIIDMTMGHLGLIFRIISPMKGVAFTIMYQARSVTYMYMYTHDYKDLFVKQIIHLSQNLHMYLSWVCLKTTHFEI